MKFITPSLLLGLNFKLINNYGVNEVKFIMDYNIKIKIQY